MSYICTPKESLCLIALTKRAAEKRPNKYNMEAKEAIVKIIKALLDIEEPTQRQLLIDYLMGRRSRQIEELGLSDKETFGIGESHDEDYWSTVIDAAYEGELLKQMASKKNALTPTTAGKKFAKKPQSFIISDDEAIGETESDVPEIDSILAQAQSIKPLTAPHRLKQKDTSSSSLP